jgi:hypothetical protein
MLSGARRRSGRLDLLVDFESKRRRSVATGNDTTPKRSGERDGRAPGSLSVPLTAELRGDLESIAGTYGVPLARLAREAMTIGLRAIRARSDSYNRRALGADEP